jgi:hypothetical protein
MNGRQRSAVRLMQARQRERARGKRDREREEGEDEWTAEERCQINASKAERASKREEREPQKNHALLK